MTVAELIPVCRINKHSHHNIEKSAMIKSSACTLVEPKKKIWPLHSCNTSTHVLCLSQCMPLILFDPHSHIFQRDKKITDYFCNIIIQLIVTTPFAKVPYEGPKRQERYLKPINNNKYNLFKDLFVSPTIVNIH
jgi:hypothetical protein